MKAFTQRREEERLRCARLKVVLSSVTPQDRALDKKLREAAQRSKQAAIEDAKVWHDYEYAHNLRP